MRSFFIAAIAFALAACGSGKSDHLTPPEPYELSGYEIPAGVSFPDDAELYGRSSQTLNGATQVSYSFKTGLPVEKLLEFFAEKNMHFSKQDDDSYEIYTGELANEAEIELRFDKVTGGATSDTMYLLTVGSAKVDIPLTSGEAT